MQGSPPSHNALAAFPFSHVLECEKSAVFQQGFSKGKLSIRRDEGHPDSNLHRYKVARLGLSSADELVACGTTLRPTRNHDKTKLGLAMNDEHLTYPQNRSSFCCHRMQVVAWDDTSYQRPVRGLHWL